VKCRGERPRFFEVPLGLTCATWIALPQQYAQYVLNVANYPVHFDTGPARNCRGKPTAVIPGNSEGDIGSHGNNRSARYRILGLNHMSGHKAWAYGGGVSPGELITATVQRVPVSRFRSDPPSLPTGVAFSFDIGGLRTNGEAQGGSGMAGAEGSGSHRP